jgi:hydrogenase maturation protease
MPDKILVLGIGNILLGDDGVGVHCVRQLQTEHCELADDVEFLDGGTLSFTLAAYLEVTNYLIVIDAAQLQQPPGAIALFEDAEMDRFMHRHKKSSVHEVSLVDLLAITRLAGHMPQHRALIALQPHSIGWSETLSEPVNRAVPKACEQALHIIKRWRDCR